METLIQGVIIFEEKDSIITATIQDINFVTKHKNYSDAYDIGEASVYQTNGRAK